jgi:hypothetical protein
MKVKKKKQTFKLSINIVIFPYRSSSSEKVLYVLFHFMAQFLQLQKRIEVAFL